MTFDPLYGYGHVYLLKEAVEKAGSTDRAKVADALHTMKIESGPAAMALNGQVAFDAKGIRVNPPPCCCSGRTACHWQSTRRTSPLPRH